MKNILIGVLIALAAVMIIELLLPLKLLFSILIGVGIGGAVTIWLLSRSRGENPKVVAKEVVAAAKAVVQEPKPTVEERAAHVQLLRMYESFVMSGKAPRLAPALQEVIGKLRLAIPRALEFAENSETTFNLVKLAREDLPSQVSAFLTLSPEDRALQQDGFIVQLAALSKKIDELLGFIDAGQADAFTTHSQFVDIKFNL